MFKQLLVPLDGSTLAEAVLPLVQAIADRFESKVTLLRVVHPPLLLADVGGPVYGELFATLRNEIHQEAAAYLAQQEVILRDKGCNVNVRVAEGEPVADVILDVADELHVDTIIMSTHGRGGLRRWLLGSVADKVLQQANVPVLLVRAQPAVQRGEEWSISVPVIEDLDAIRSHEER